jgi:hypothetical protein
VSTRIRVALVEQGVSAASVQKAAEITEGTWYARMRKPGSWRLAELRRVAAVLGVPVATLVADD